MKAIVFHDIGDVRLEDVPEPRIQHPGDAIVRLTESAICGTDLHFVRGTMPGTKAGRILGHEGVGVVAEVGEYVRNFVPGERVVIGSTIACGTCSYCRAGYTAQCDTTNPNATTTAFYGGPEAAGGYDGLQAERARIPWANFNLVPLPDEVTDEQAILVSDIFPTGWQGALEAEITPGDVVCVFGCGPVGQFAIASARLQGAGRVIAVDSIADRLEMARAQHAEVIDFEREDPVEMLAEMTRGIGPDRVIDAVGVEADRPGSGPAADGEERFEAQVETIAPDGDPSAARYAPGTGPSQALEWAVQGIAKAGTLSIIGVYPPHMEAFPIGAAMLKNLTIKTGNCNHRTHIPHLLEMIRAGAIDPTTILTRHEGITSAIDAYERFDQRERGWLKVGLQPAA